MVLRVCDVGGRIAFLSFISRLGLILIVHKQCRVAKFYTKMAQNAMSDQEGDCWGRRNAVSLREQMGQAKLRRARCLIPSTNYPISISLSY